MNFDHRASAFLTVLGTLLTGLSFMEIVNTILAIAVLILGGMASISSLRKDKKAEKYYNDRNQYYTDKKKEDEEKLKNLDNEN